MPGLLDRRELLWGLPAAGVAAGGAAARLRVEIRERGAKQPTPARVYLTDGQGKLHAPEGAIVYRRREEEHFITAGRFELELPPGKYSLQAERGLEYPTAGAELVLGAGEMRELRLELERWIAMNERGWYSADLHNHRKVDEMPALLLAEDLNLAPTITDWIWEGRPISTPPETTEAIRRVDARHAFSVLDKEVERLRHGPGAVDLLGLRKPIPFEGDWLYPPNDVFCRLAHAQGGWVDAEKIMWRDIPALAALGHIDFAGVVHNHFNRHGVETETEPWGMAPKDRPEYDTPRGLALWTLDIYYRLLNCGLRLPVSAGSASAVKAAPLGYNRVYARLEESFSYENWFRALKRGCSFATNGPILFLTADGRLPGATIERPAAGGRLRVKVEAHSAGAPEKLELLFKGRVVEATGRTSLETELEVKESGWVAARAFEPAAKTVRFAQTSPIWIRAGRDPGIVASDALYFAAWLRREAEFYRRETRFQSPAHRQAMVALLEAGERAYRGLAALTG
jgi:hypothetical protein